MSRLLALLGLVRRSDLVLVTNRLLAEVDQQKGYIATSKKKLEKISLEVTKVKGRQEDIQALHQEIHNFTGRVFGLEVSVATIRDLLR